MAKWYYSVDGRAEGPVGDEVIVDNLKAGKLTLVDLVFKEGEDRWHALGDIPQFKDAFAKVNLPPNPVAATPAPGATKPSSQSSDSSVHTVTNSTTPLATPLTPPKVAGGPFKFEPSPDLKWVVLQKKNSGNDEQFLQSGPFSADQIAKMLARGECKYSDYVWRPGYHRWARLGNLPEFDRRIKSRDGDKTPEMVPLPKIEIETHPAAKELENVVRARAVARPTLRAAEPPPENTDGRDLAEITATNFEVGAVEKPSIPDPPASFASPSVPSARPTATPSARANSMSSPASSSSSRPTPPPLDDDAKTVVYSGPKVGARGGGAPSTNYDPDRTMIQPSQGMPPSVSAEDVDSEDGAMDLEEIPTSFFQRFKKPLIAAVVVLLLVVAGWQLRNRDFNFGKGTSGEQAAEETPPAPEAAEPSVANQAPPVQPPVETAPKAATPAPAVAAATPAATATPAVDPQAQAAMAAGIKPIPPGVGKTTVLDIVPVRTDTIRPQFALNTNAPVGSPIYFLIAARSGEVLRFPSFQATQTIVRAGAEVPTVDLSNLKLAPGQYRIEAASGDIRRTRTVFIGVKNEFFQDEMERHLKQVSFQQQNEKKAMFHSARKMETLARTLGETYAKSRTDARRWGGFYSTWQKDLKLAEKILLARITLDKRNELAYPDEIFALKQATTKLKDQAKDLNDSVMAGAQARDVAGTGNLAIVKEFARLKTQAANISSRR